MGRAAKVSRDSAKQQTRDALVTAALALFAEEGLTGPSLDAICERAGYTRGAFYVHFADRDALLVAVMEKVGEAFLASVFADPPETNDGRDSSVSLARAADEEGEDDADEFHGIGHAASRPALEPPPPKSSARSPSLLADAAERFVHAIAKGTYPLMPPPAKARAARARSGAQVHVRPHQLIEACSRSPVVRERYRALVEASVDHVAELTAADQATEAVREDVDPRAVGSMLLAIVLGAQTMAEIGVPVNPAAMTEGVIRLLRKPRL